MGFGKWLRRKIDEFDEKQRRKMEERRQFEQRMKTERIIAREREIGRLEAPRELERRLEKQRDPFGFERSAKASDDYWQRVSGTRPYGTKRKKKK